MWQVPSGKHKRKRTAGTLIEGKARPEVVGRVAAVGNGGGPALVGPPVPDGKPAPSGLIGVRPVEVGGRGCKRGQCMPGGKRKQIGNRPS